MQSGRTNANPALVPAHHFTVNFADINLAFSVFMFFSIGWKLRPALDIWHVLRRDLAQVEFPVALIDRNLDKKPPEARAAAEAFVQYCFTPAAQREFAACGFRRVCLHRSRCIDASPSHHVLGCNQHQTRSYEA